MAKQEFNRHMAVSGLKHSNGWIDEEFLPQLKTLRQRVKVWAEMRDNDATVGAFLFIIDMLIRNVKWAVEPLDQNNKEDLDAAAFVETCVKDIGSPWEDFISEVLSMLPYGFCLLEKIFKLRKGEKKDLNLGSKYTDGKIGWAKFAVRSQDSLDRWIFDEKGNTIGFVQLDPNKFNFIEVPLNKCLHFRTSTFKNNPEGRSILRSSYKSYFYKKNIESIEGIGIERDLAGLPVMRIPSELMANNSTAYDAYKDIVRNIRRDEMEGVIIPSDVDMNGNRSYELELLSAAGGRQFNTNDIINRYDKRIATTVAADFIFLGQDKAGSFALSSDKTNLFASAIGAWLKSISATFKRQAIDELLKLNNMPGECYITHTDIEKEDVEKIGRLMQSMASAGAVFDNEQFNAVLEMAGIPPLSDPEIAGT